jgi:type I restriction enzyme M protein
MNINQYLLQKSIRPFLLCGDCLEILKNFYQEIYQTETKAKIALASFDILLTNPPFGSKIPVAGEEKLSQFDVGHKWKFN